MYKDVYKLTIIFFLGDGYVRLEFPILLTIVLVAVALRHLHQKILICLHIPMHFISIVLLLYGKIQQKEISRSDTWPFNQLDHEMQPIAVSDSEKQSAHDFIHFSMVTWIASVLFDIRIMQFIGCDIVTIMHNIIRLNHCHKPTFIVLVLNATFITAMVSMMEYSFITSISSEWQVVVYMVLSNVVSLLRTLYQGKRIYRCL